MAIDIVLYDDGAHRADVIQLWEQVFKYGAAHNAPDLVIDQKMAVDDGLLFVATSESTLTGTVMAGYDGHRGWIYSLAVNPDYRNQGIGTKLLSHAESRLAARGCTKINLQIMEGNEHVQLFYESNGYSTENRISMGKRLTQ